MTSTKDVLEHHIRCFGEGDLKGILSEFGQPGTAFSLKHQSVEGDYAYVLWAAETADNVDDLGTDTTVVRDGKIVAQSFAGKTTPKS